MATRTPRKIGRFETTRSNGELKKIEAALLRAEERARETARIHGTKLYFSKDGEIIEEDPYGPPRPADDPKYQIDPRFGL